MRNNPSLASLRLFLRVAQTRSFSETARTENVSQPALSRTIRLLEEELGVRLFDRNTRNVNLTPAGEELLPTVERLTNDFDHAFSELAQTFKGQRGRIVVGALPSVAAVFLPKAIATLHAQRPQIEVTIRDDLSAPLLQQLEERQIDFAVTIRPEPSDRLSFRPLLADDCVLVFPRGDDLDTEGPAAWSVFETRPFVAMAPRSSVRLMTDAAFIQAGLAVKPLYECSHLATVGGLIAAGLGVSALPHTTLPLLNSPTLRWRQLERPTLSRSIGIVSLRRRSNAPASDAFIEVLAALLSSGSLRDAAGQVPP